MNGIRFAFRIAGLWMWCVPGMVSHDSRAESPSCEQELRSTLEGLSRAYAAADLEAILAYYSDYFTGMQPPFTKDEIRNVTERLIRSSRRISLELRPREFRCVGDLAMVTADVKFEWEPTDRAAPEVEELTEHIQLEKQDGRWKILWYYALAPEEEAPQSGAEYRMPESGFAVRLPKGFRYHMCEFKRSAPAIIGVAEELKSVLSIRGMDMRVLIKPEQLADIMEKKIRYSFPACEVVRKEVRRVGELPAVLVDTECPGFRGPLWDRTVLVMNEENLFSVDVVGLDKTMQADMAAIIDGALATFRTIPIETKPAERGGLVGNRYRDEQYGLEVRLPEGWKVNTNQGGMLALAESPCGRGIIRVYADDLVEDLDAMNLIEKANEVTGRIVANYACEKKGDIRSGSLLGAQSVARFDLAEPVKRWRAYFVTQGRAYLIVCDVQPADDFGAFEGAFRATIESLRVDEARSGAKE